MKFKKLLFVAILLAGGSILFAQTDTSKFTYNVRIGTTGYQGDYASEFFSFTHGVSFGVGVSRYINPSFDIVANVNYGKIQGDPLGANGVKSMPAGVNFKANLTCLNILLKYKFTNGYLLKESAKLSPYLLAGAGTLYNASSGVGFSGAFSGSTKEKVLAANLSLGLGLRYRLTNKLGIFIQTLELATGTDKIDGWYPDVPSNKKNDKLLLNTIGITYTPGS